MKKKSLIALEISLMLSIILPICNATTATLYTVELLDTASVVIDSNNPSGKIAYLEPQNVYTSFKVNGTGPGKFQEKNFNDALLEDFGERNEGEEYPFSFGQTGTAAPYDIIDPWDVRWIETENNSELTSTNNYTYYIEANRLGTIAPSIPVEYYLEVISNDKWYELDLQIETPGVYFIYYDPEATISTHIISPDGIETYATMMTLPSVSPHAAGSTRQPIKKFILFTAYTEGNYQFYFDTNIHAMIFDLQEANVQQTFEPGNYIKFFEEENPNLESLNSDGQLIYHIYPFECTAFEPLYFNYQTIWGYPSVFYVIQDSDTGKYTVNAASSNPDNQFIMSQYSGKGYFFILNLEYLRWAYNDYITPYRQLLAYSLGLDKIPAETYGNDNDTTFSVDPSIGYKYIKFNISAHTYITINGTATTGSPLCDLSSLYREEVNGAVIVNHISTYDDLYLYELSSGMYYVRISHSLNKDEIEYFKIEININSGGTVPFTSWNKDIEEEFTVHNNLSSVSTNLESFEYPFHSYPYGTDEILRPQIYPFEYNNYFQCLAGVQFDRDDNPDIFERVISQEDMVIWIYNDTLGEYFNLTGDSTATDLFWNGTADTEFAYIGSPIRFDRINIELKSGNESISVEPNDYLNWTIYDGTGSFSTSNNWDDLETTADWNDTTWLPNTTLSQSGMISFDPVDATVNAGKREFPTSMATNASSKPMYWVRLESNIANPFSIPALTAGENSVTLYQYIDIQLDVEITINQISKYDGKTLVTVMQSVITQDIFSNNFGINQVVDNVTSITGSIDLMGTGNASVIYWPKNVWIMDYSQGPTGTLVQFNETLNLRIFVSDMSGQYTKVDYGNSSGVSYFGEDLENDPVTNFGTYTDYGLSSYTFNATEYKGTMISLTGTQMYDWYQFILRTNNTDETKMYLVFDNPWYQNAVPTMNQHLDIFPFSIVDNFNDTREFGIPIDKFWVVIEANDKNPILNGTVKYWLNIASYGVEILNVSTYIGEVIYLTPPPPEWVLPTAIGSSVGGAVIAIVILIVRKKKKGY